MPKGKMSEMPKDCMDTKGCDIPSTSRFHEQLKKNQKDACKHGKGMAPRPNNK